MSLCFEEWKDVLPWLIAKTTKSVETEFTVLINTFSALSAESRIPSSRAPQRRLCTVFRASAVLCGD